MVIEVYTTNFCGYCIRAKNLLIEKKVPFYETNLTKKPNKRSEMVERSGGRSSVPQIFVSNMHIGGCDDMYRLEKSGQLDIILMDKK